MYIYTGTIPAKLFLQLSTAFQKGGLCNRNGTFFYKEHLKKSNIPVLALAGDQDLICPPEAVYGKIPFQLYMVRFSCASLFICMFLFCFVRQHGVETVKMIPKHSASFKVFGEPRGPHYAHYDIVGGRLVRCDLKYFMLVIHWPLNFILFQLD